MKKGYSVYQVVFIIVIILICLFPVYGSIFDQGYQLQGVSSSSKEVSIDFNSIWTGSMQNALETKIKENIPGRTGMVRLNSQYMYSLLNSSSNSNVVIGNNHSLFEPEYLNDYLNLWPLMSNDAQDTLISNLNQLQSLLEGMGKKLYLFITPSKVRYDYANIPWFFRALSRPKLKTNYDGFIRRLSKTSIPYFDSIEYINNYMTDETVFYSSGIHWSNATAARVTKGFLEDLNDSTGYDLGSITVSLTDSNEGKAPDRDLLSTLNLYYDLNNDSYMIPEISYIPGSDHPNVLMRGGSFMGQSLAKLVQNKIFNNSFYFENNIVITNGTDVRALSDFNAYDEIDLQTEVDIADLVILEVNEEKIWIMGWGIIEELIHVLQSGTEEMDIQFLGQGALSTDLNPWGTNIGYINYHGNRSIVMTSPTTEVRFRVAGKEKTVDFDAEIHEWVRKDSDGCILVIKQKDSKQEEIECPILAGLEDNPTVHVSFPVEDTCDVSITFRNEEGKTLDCDWVVISNIDVKP